MENEQRQLRQLGNYHYILGFFIAFLGCFPVLYIVSSALVLTHQVQIAGMENSRSSEQIATFSMIISFIVLVGIWTMSLLLIRAGRYLKSQKQFAFCWRMAFLQCALFPFGTLLGWHTMNSLKDMKIQRLFPDAPRNATRETTASLKSDSPKAAEVPSEKTPERKDAGETEIVEPETVA